MPTLNLHPKIKAALLTAIAAGVITVANAVANVYPTNAVVLLLVGFAPVVAGWLTSSPKPVVVTAATASTAPVSTIHVSYPPQGTAASSSSASTITFKPTPTDPPPPPIDPPAAA